ncbi:MAG: hypothetical protein ACJ8AS_01340, partial [Hyphomicrobiales bacterium]
ATVLAWRLPMLGMMIFEPSPRRRAEAVRMIAEKQAALAEAIVSTQAELMLNLLDPSRSRTTEGMADAALAPVRRRVKANARRLKRRRSI